MYAKYYAIDDFLSKYRDARLQLIKVDYGAIAFITLPDRDAPMDYGEAMNRLHLLLKLGRHAQVEEFWRYSLQTQSPFIYIDHNGKFEHCMIEICNRIYHLLRDAELKEDPKMIDEKIKEWQKFVREMYLKEVK